MSKILVTMEVGEPLDDGRLVTRYETVPPGLLISLGGGRAIERTVEHLARALCDRDPDQVVRTVATADSVQKFTRAECEMDRARAILSRLIQQAQESR